MTRSMLAAMAVASLMCSHAALAGDEEKEAPSLSVGDAAPALEISHWLKGEKIAEFEEGKVYVIEFWATWCGPCVASMPHLTELQEKYKDYDVTVIGISDEPLPTVVEFLFKKNKRDGKINHERTHYTLTADPDRSVMEAYHRAAGQRGIPSAFIVGKDTKVEWIGHPVAMDEALDAVVRDSWDRASFKTQFETERANREKANAIGKALQTAMRESDYDTAIARIDELVALGGPWSGYRVQKFEILAKDIGDYKAAYAEAAAIVKDSWDDPNILNQIGWFIVDEAGLERRDHDLALKAAKRANELTEGKSGAILDTVARVYYEKGELDKALVYQRKAVKNADGPMLEDLEKTLKKYEKESR